MKNVLLRLTCLVLAFSLCCGLAACTVNINVDPTNPPTEPTDPPTEPTDPPTEPTDPPTEPTDPPTEPGPTDHVHVYTDYTYAASCRAGGYTKHVCECGESYIDSYTAKLSHNYKTEQIEATETVQAHTLYTCINCSTSYRGNYVWGEMEDFKEFFNDAVFIGDSVTQGLYLYDLSTDALGKAKFFGVPCYGLYHSLSTRADRVCLSYQGEKLYPGPLLQKTGAKKVFLMLGMNDVGMLGFNEMKNYWNNLIDHILDYCPGIEIYIQSATPIYTDGQIFPNLTNERMDTYNENIKAMCVERGLHYIDIASYLKDSTNGLAKEYTSDKYVHLTNAANEVWVQVLKNYLQGDSQ